jgi:hypothetical protein
MRPSFPSMSMAHLRLSERAGPSGLAPMRIMWSRSITGVGQPYNPRLGRGVVRSHCPARLGGD